MAAVFQVECCETQPGDGVFVVGSHSALGDFNPQNAVPLTTSADSFPLWTSDPVVLTTGVDANYKYIVQTEARTGSVNWESLQECNRSVKTVPGIVTTVRTKWGVYESHMSTAVDEALVADAVQRQEEESDLITKAESFCEEAKAQVPENSVASTIMARDPMHRNFSQSLLGALLDVDSAEDLAALAAEGNSDDERKDLATKVTEAEVKAEGYENAPMEPVKTFNRRRASSMASSLAKESLKHITSLCALSDMADAAEKDEARLAHRKPPQYEPHNTDVPVVVVTSEVAPWSKTGGLGLVAASYSYEFPRSGHRTMVVSPKYKHYDGIEYVGETVVTVNGGEHLVKYFHLLTESGCDCIFVEHPTLERGGGIYSDANGCEYGDNLFRFTLLSLAALEAPLVLRLGGTPYGDKVLFLANDWQAGLVPLYICHKYRKNNVYSQARVIYAVHNLGYQGQYHGVNACSFFGVDGQAASDLAWGKSINLCKGALTCADRVVAVSPNYAQEIQTPAHGFGLHDVVRAKAHSQRLVGILNGIDDAWNPLTDHVILRNYSVDDFIEGKRKNKAALQKDLNLQLNPDCVLIGFTGRLTSQKGIDILGAIVPWLMQDTGNGVTGNVQLIMMGNGDKGLAEVLRRSEDSYKGRVCGYVGFDPTVEHKIMAGCDIFLMPSRYEPCGLPQMISQKYGTLPIVTATGGLRDSVKDVSCGETVATGFHIPNLDQAKVKEVIYKAAELFVKSPATFQTMQRTAMQSDFYWTRAIDEYERQIDVALYDAPIHR
jgi:starch synthase